MKKRIISAILAKTMLTFTACNDNAARIIKAISITGTKKSK